MVQALLLGATVAIASDGGILVAVQAVAGTTFDFTLARFHSDGAIDTAFGTQGVVTTALGADDDFARGMSLQSDGRIVVAGQSSSVTVSDFGIAQLSRRGHARRQLRRPRTTGGRLLRRR